MEKPTQSKGERQAELKGELLAIEQENREARAALAKLEGRPTKPSSWKRNTTIGLASAVAATGTLGVGYVGGKKMGLWGKDAKVAQSDSAKPLTPETPKPKIYSYEELKNNLPDKIQKKIESQLQVEKRGLEEAIKNNDQNHAAWKREQIALLNSNPIKFYQYLIKWNEEKLEENEKQANLNEEERGKAKTRHINWISEDKEIITELEKASIATTRGVVQLPGNTNMTDALAKANAGRTNPPVVAPAAPTNNAAPVVTRATEAPPTPHAPKGESATNTVVSAPVPAPKPAPELTPTTPPIAPTRTDLPAIETKKDTATTNNVARITEVEREYARQLEAEKAKLKEKDEKIKQLEKEKESGERRAKELKKQLEDTMQTVTNPKGPETDDEFMIRMNRKFELKRKGDGGGKLTPAEIAIVDSITRDERQKYRAIANEITEQRRRQP